MTALAIFVGGCVVIAVIRWSRAPRFMRRCRPCGYEFETVAGLDRHVRQFHRE